MQTKTLSRILLILVLIGLPVTASVTVAADSVTTLPEARDGIQLETEEDATEEAEQPAEDVEDEAEETVDEVTQEEPSVVVVEEDDDEVLGTGLLILLGGIFAVIVVGGWVIWKDRYNRP